MFRSGEDPFSTVRVQPVAPARQEDGWLAKLDIAFQRPAQEGGKVRLDFRHQGPLRIQKALYPEGAGCCHAVLIHPPGGIASGDRLELKIKSEAATHGLITTPSATKWYGAQADQNASQSVAVELHGALEWLPMETIIFNQARVDSDITIQAGPQAQMIGWDQLIFGRQASGESFAQGLFKQSLQVELDGQLQWHDRLVLHGDDALFSSPIGLRGHHSTALLWALLKEGQTWTDTALEDLRLNSTSLAWTRLHPRLLIGRLLAEPLELKALMIQAWKTLRPLVFDIQAIEPRLWAT